MNMVKNISTGINPKMMIYMQMRLHQANRILVVDDEEFCISSMKSIFAGARVDVENNVDFCINGQEAVNHIKDSSNAGITFSIIFTDFSMPVMNGIDACKAIR